MKYFSILLTAILVENYVFTQFLGICPFLGVSQNLSTALGMSGAVIAVMLLASAVTWPVYHYILAPQNLAYLQTLLFILIIAALVQVLEIFLKRFIPALYEALGVYLPLITTNCIVLGVVVLNVEQNYTFLESLINALGGGLGFSLAMFLFAGIRSRLDQADIPEFMQGLPITLIAAGISSLAFMGFSGLAHNMFA